MPDILQRRLQLAPSTFNREAGTVEAVLSSGAGVQRRDARGAFTERLSVAAGAVALHTPRLPILDSHRQGSIGDVLGFVENVRAEGGEIRATLHITDARARDLIENGAVTGVSIGYRVAPTDWAEAEGGRVRTAARWTLLEVSLVPVPADPGAILRSAEDMPDTNVPPVADAVQTRAAVNASIRSLARNLGLGAEFADAQIDLAADLAAARAAAAVEMERRSAAAPIRTHATTGESNDDPAVIRTRMTEALAHRMGAPGDLAEPARQYRGLGLAEMARIALVARGERVMGTTSGERIITRAMETGDLPNLLQGAGARTLLGAYTPALSPVFSLFRQTTATDFRTMSRVRMGEMDGLEKVAEGGEVTRGGFGEVAEAYRIDTYARIVGLSRQAIVNDDLGAFAQMTAMQGRAAAEKQNALAVALLTEADGAGPVLSDGTRMFHASRGNSGAGAAASAVTPDSIAGGILALRLQKGVDGVSPINAVPRFLLAGPEAEADARRAVAAYYPATSATASPFADAPAVLIDARLAGPRWWMFADPAVMHCFEYAFLASAPGPQFESRAGWDVLGMEFRVVLDFGCGAVGWRGSYVNSGESL